ncbi:hypothetical protein EBS80_02265 [bacterium]|nr:hypothetical protein [bacterium]
MKNLSSKIGAGLSALSTLALPFVVHAQAYEGLAGANASLTDVASDGGLSQTELPTLIGQLINVLLGVLGIVFVILVVYAGFLYLTSQGEEGNVKKAKKLLTQAVIGLIIIIAAYAISSYVISALVTASA